MISELLEYVIFPGAIFIVVFAIFLVWLMRKITARLEDRIGPPFLQPFWDFAKLLAKERVYPRGAMKNIQHYMPIIQFALAIFMAFFLPIFSDGGLISFEGDIYFFLFLLALHGSTVFFIGWASKNPYAQAGAGRAVMIEMSLEIPLAISIAGIAIMTKSMRIAEITENISDSVFSFDNPLTLLLIIPWLILFGTTLISTMGALELNPFSAAHAETEIVAGWMTELTGPDLAMVKLAEYINIFNMTAIIVAVFLGGPTVLELESAFLTGLIGLLTFILKCVLVMFIIAFIKTLSSRMRVDQTTNILWKYLLPISMFGVLLVMLVVNIGG